MKVTYISSYVPRKCGIATYTRDLAEEVEILGNSLKVVAMENKLTPNMYTEPVVAAIDQHDKKSYIKAAELINSDLTEIVHLQHEFGLFGGVDGEFIVDFARHLKKPLVVTFHTVLLTPSDSQKKIIQELTRLSRKVIVMDKIGCDRLVNIYGLNLEDVSIILHGAPVIEKKDLNASKKEIGYSDKFIMLANNLLSRNKGIEYAIGAVAKAAIDIPNLLFLIVGETHPLVKASEGESYRDELEALVNKLKIQKNVVFKNEYVSKEELKTILSAADVYVTPYLDPQQISSGTLSYAIGASKACIATEYVYAKEMLINNKGVLVPFRDSEAIAVALVELYKNPEKKLQMEKKVKETGKDMSWSKVAQKHIGIYKKVILAEVILSNRVAEFLQKPANISYMMQMTNSTGIVQHANTVFPDLKFGYSTCDNARALIVAALMYERYGSDEFLRLIKVYADFLDLAQEKDGKFHTFLNSEKVWTDKAEVNDGFGRAIWGLGFSLYTIQNEKIKKRMSLLFEKSLLQMQKVIDLRTAAYCILGLYYYILANPGKNNLIKPAKNLMKKLGEYVKGEFYANQKLGWEWFEQKITYDNFRLPQALFALFLITKETEYKEIGEGSLKFITECNFDEKNGYYDFIGQDGWHSLLGQKANYDQQPLEVAGVVEANIFASLATSNDAYLKEGYLAFEWFFGNNRNHRSIYDFSSKGVADGLTSRGVNVNQGAESVICFLLSNLSLQVKSESMFIDSQIKESLISKKSQSGLQRASLANNDT